MIDKEKVIKGLNYCTHTDGVECPNCPYWQDDDCVEVLNADVLALLKEQEPKKIIRKQMSYEDPDGTITYYAEWHCPHCNKVVRKGYDSPWIKYCFNCGKPILWD